MNIKIPHLSCVWMVIFLGCGDSSVPPPKIYAPIPEEPAWKLEQKFADSTSAKRIALVSHYTIDPQNIDFIKLATSNHIEYAKKHKYDYYFRNGTIKGSERFFDPQGKNRTFQLGLYWQKVQALEDALQLKENDKYVYDYVFWIDTDAVFTAMDRPIEHYINNASKDIYFYIADDLSSLSYEKEHTCINAGVFMVQNSPKGRDLIANLGKSFKIYKSFVWPEQAALQDLAYGYLQPADIDKIAQNKQSLETFLSQTVKRDCKASPPNDIKVYSMTEFNGAYAFDSERVQWNAGSFTAHFLSFDGFMTQKYLRPLLDCLIKNNYQNRERCTPQELNAYR